jgi:hypothetical protein
MKHQYRSWSLLFTLMTCIHFIYVQIINPQINLKTKPNMMNNTLERKMVHMVQEDTNSTDFMAQSMTLTWLKLHFHMRNFIRIIVQIFKQTSPPIHSGSSRCDIKIPRSPERYKSYLFHANIVEHPHLHMVCILREEIIPSTITALKYTLGEVFITLFPFSGFQNFIRNSNLLSRSWGNSHLYCNSKVNFN